MNDHEIARLFEKMCTDQNLRDKVVDILEAQLKDNDYYSADERLRLECVVVFFGEM